MLIFEPTPGSEPKVEELLRGARRRAEAAGWHCWAYRNEINSSELTLFIEGPAPAPGADAPPVFGDEIAGLRALSRRFESVRSLKEYSLDDQP
ncbi:MAG TPA: hypothetical protein VMF70_12520 [Gemmatimonadales bacterium]|nr:hypothetical protein [Gemmatimonadales bacterium]